MGQREEGKGTREPSMLMFVFMLMQSFCTPGVWRLGWGEVRDEARKIVRNWAVGTWWARIGSMDQSQGTVPGVKLASGRHQSSSHGVQRGMACLGLI